MKLLRTEARELRDDDTWGDPLADRERDSSARRSPLGLITALRDRVELGKADPELLAWLLDVPVDEIDFPEVDEIAAATEYQDQVFSDRPLATHWAETFRSGSEAAPA